MSGKQAGSLESGKQNTNKKQKLSKRPISPGQSRRRRRRLTTNLLSVIMWHRETIQLNGKRARLFPRTATNLLDGLGRPFTSGGGKNVQWIATWGNLNYLPRTFPFSRTVRPYCRYSIYGESTPRRSLQQTVGESSQGKTNFWLWIDENRFK